MEYCTKCGSELDTEMQFCTKCGAKVERGEEQAEKKGFLMGLSKRTVIILAIVLGPTLIGFAGNFVFSGWFLIGLVVFFIIRNKKRKEANNQLIAESNDYVTAHPEIDYHNTLIESTDLKCLAKYGKVLNFYKEHDNMDRYNSYHEFMTSFVPYGSDSEMGISSFDYIGGKRVYGFFTDKDLMTGNTTKPNVICVCDDYTLDYWLNGDDHVIDKTNLFQYGHMYVRGISTSESKRALAKRLCKIYPDAHVVYLNMTGGYVDGVFGLREATEEEKKYLTHKDLYSVVDCYAVSGRN